MILPEPLLEDIANGRCLPFIGAGFSKNAKLPPNQNMPDWDELTKILLKDLTSTQSTDRLDIAERYEKKYDRRKLIEIIEKVLLINIAKPGEVHLEFAKINDFHVVYTTNFDNLLEDAYKQVDIPSKSLAGPQQVVMLSNPPTVNIIKMHGDLFRPEHLVVTREDYDNYIKNFGVIVTQLSHYLMTMTPLFLGYSLSDPNFILIRKMIEDALGKFIPKAYIVLLNPTDDEIKKYELMNLHVIPLKSDTQSNSELLLELLKEISLYKSVSQLPDGIEVKPKKHVVIYGGPLMIRTRIKPNPNEQNITLKILNQKGDIVHQSNIPIQGFEQFTQISVKGSQWIPDAWYKIEAKFGDKTATYPVYISKSLPIVLQTDKSVYLYGSDLIATVVNPNVISNDIPIQLEISDIHGKLVYKNSIPVSDDSNGIYQEIIFVGGKDWDRTPGSMFRMVAEYAEHTAEVTFRLSDFGATVLLDQKVYTWTDRVYITIVAPDRNYDPNLKDTIGDEKSGKIIVSTKNHSLRYKLEETGPDAGIFTGYVILTGDTNIKGSEGVDGKGNKPSGEIGGAGPTDGFIPANSDDEIIVTYEYTQDKPIKASAKIKWNIGMIRWLESSYPANGVGVLQIVDPDMNLDPKAIDKFETRVWSDSDPNGIVVSMTETGESTGIFQAKIQFSDTQQSSGNGLKVSDGDGITGEYIDRTLPSPYTPNDKLRLTATTTIGKIIPPFERATLTNPRITDSSGNMIKKITVGQQIHITAHLSTGLDKDQPFAFLVQIVDKNGSNVDLKWITGTLVAGHIQNPSIQWIPQIAGDYTAQIFVWKSIDHPSPICRPRSVTINVV